VRAAARSEYARLAREHEPEPMPDDVLAELDAIVAAASGSFSDAMKARADDVTGFPVRRRSLSRRVRPLRKRGGDGRRLKEGGA